MENKKSSKGLIEENKPFIIVCLVALFYSIAAGGLWFLLPLLAEQFTKDIFLVGLLLSIPYMVSLFLAVPSGALSDRVGRKTVGVLGLLVVICTGLILPFVDSLVGFVFFVGFLGLSVQLINTPARAYIMDFAPGEKASEYFGVFTAFFNLGLMIGPLIIGFLMMDSLSIGVSTASNLYILIGLMGLVIFAFIPETVKNREPFLSGIRNVLFQDGIFRRAFIEFRELKKLGGLILLLTVFFTITDGMNWTLEPLYYQKMGFDSGTGGLILSLFILPLIILGLPAGYIADRYGKMKSLIFGLALAGTSLIFFGLSNNSLYLFLSAFLTGTGLTFAWASVSGLITNISADKDRGNITGVWNMSMDLGYVIGPFIGGLLAETLKDIGRAYIFMGIALILLCILVLIYNKKD